MQLVGHAATLKAVCFHSTPTMPCMYTISSIHSVKVYGDIIENIDLISTSILIVESYIKKPSPFHKALKT